MSTGIKKRHDHANQLQLLLGYEEMQKKKKSLKSSLIGCNN